VLKRNCDPWGLATIRANKSSPSENSSQDSDDILAERALKIHNRGHQSSLALKFLKDLPLKRALETVKNNCVACQKFGNMNPIAAHSSRPPVVIPNLEHQADIFFLKKEEDSVPQACLMYVDSATSKLKVSRMQGGMAFKAMYKAMQLCRLAFAKPQVLVCDLQFKCLMEAIPHLRLVGTNEHCKIAERAILKFKLCWIRSIEAPDEELEWVLDVSDTYYDQVILDHVADLLNESPLTLKPYGLNYVCPNELYISGRIAYGHRRAYFNHKRYNFAQQPLSKAKYVPQMRDMIRIKIHTEEQMWLAGYKVIEIDAEFHHILAHPISGKYGIADRWLSWRMVKKDICPPVLSDDDTNSCTEFVFESDSSEEDYITGRCNPAYDTGLLTLPPSPTDLSKNPNPLSDPCFPQSIGMHGESESDDSLLFIDASSNGHEEPLTSDGQDSCHDVPSDGQDSCHDVENDECDDEFSSTSTVHERAKSPAVDEVLPSSSMGSPSRATYLQLLASGMKYWSPWRHPVGAQMNEDDLNLDTDRSVEPPVETLDCSSATAGAISPQRQGVTAEAISSQRHDLVEPIMLHSTLFYSEDTLSNIRTTRSGVVYGKIRPEPVSILKLDPKSVGAPSKGPLGHIIHSYNRRGSGREPNQLTSEEENLIQLKLIRDSESKVDSDFDSGKTELLSEGKSVLSINDQLNKSETELGQLTQTKDLSLEAHLQQTVTSPPILVQSLTGMQPDRVQNPDWHPSDITDPEIYTVSSVNSSSKNSDEIPTNLEDSEISSDSQKYVVFDLGSTPASTPPPTATERIWPHSGSSFPSSSTAVSGRRAANLAARKTSPSSPAPRRRQTARKTIPRPKTPPPKLVKTPRKTELEKLLSPVFGSSVQENPEDRPHRSRISVLRLRRVQCHAGSKIQLPELRALGVLPWEVSPKSPVSARDVEAYLAKSPFHFEKVRIQMDGELDQYRTISIVVPQSSVPKGTSICGYCWVFTWKTDDKNEQYIRTRLCIRETKSDDEDVFCPCLDRCSWKLALAFWGGEYQKCLADPKLPPVARVVIDISKAYLHTTTEECLDVWNSDKYVRIPGFKNRDNVWKLTSAGYGLRSAPKIFRHALDATVAPCGITASYFDSSLWLSKDKSVYFQGLVQADDIDLFGTLEMCTKVVETLRRRWPITTTWWSSELPCKSWPPITYCAVKTEYLIHQGVSLSMSFKKKATDELDLPDLLTTDNLSSLIGKLLWFSACGFIQYVPSLIAAQHLRTALEDHSPDEESIVESRNFKRFLKKARQLSHILIPPINMNNFLVLGFSDSSLGTYPRMGSIIGLLDLHTYKYAIVSSFCKKIVRKCDSPLLAELIGCVGSVDLAEHIAWHIKFAFNMQALPSIIVTIDNNGIITHLAQDFNKKAKIGPVTRNYSYLTYALQENPELSIIFFEGKYHPTDPLTKSLPSLEAYENLQSILVGTLPAGVLVTVEELTGQTAPASLRICCLGCPRPPPSLICQDTTPGRLPTRPRRGIFSCQAIPQGYGLTAAVRRQRGQNQLSWMRTIRSACSGTPHPLPEGR